MATLAVAAAIAHETPAHAAGPSGAVTGAALRLSADRVPLAARYVVTISPGPDAKLQKLRKHDWYFFRDGRQVALLKEAIDELWHRDDNGRLSFERVFHDDQRAVDYSAGELAALGIRADWSALSTFVDPRELLSLTLASRSGRGADERLHLKGRMGGESVSVEWLPALQLPVRVVRTNRARAVTRIELKQYASAAPADWPRPGVRSADYLRLDAADFGDMAYDKVVKQSEALDVRLGWRAAHGHD